MEDIKELMCVDDQVLNNMLSQPTAVAAILSFVVRDMRALWVAEYNIRLIAVVEAVRPWYRNVANEALPTEFLSALTRPKGDRDEGLAHRLLALARAASSNDPPDSLLFAVFRVTSYRLLDALFSTCNLFAITDARAILDETFAYLENAMRRKYPDVDFRRDLEEHIRRLIACWERISSGFAAEERLLLGESAADPDLRSATEKLESVAADVRTLVRRAKVSPASGRTQKWVLDQWFYYAAHPEALSSDVSRRRVHVKDVWEAIMKTAQSEYHISTLADFNRIRRTALRRLEREEN